MGTHTQSVEPIYRSDEGVGLKRRESRRRREITKHRVIPERREITKHRVIPRRREITKDRETANGAEE